MGDGAVKTVVVDLAHVVDDIDTRGVDGIHATILYDERPLGVLELPSPGDAYSGGLLVRRACCEFDARFVDVLIDDLLQPRVSPSSESTSATIAVCTRDRPEQLARCLAALSQLSPSSGIDVLIVDNGDGSSRSAVENRDFAWVHETVPGLDRARNRALHETDSEIVIFCDDDVEVHPNWADKLVACFDDPLVGAAGGLVLPSRLDTLPQRLTERHASFQRGYARRTLDGTRDSPLRAGLVGAGASLAVRRSLMCDLGGFPEELDGGTPTRSGGDTFGVYRILRAGYRAIYEPEALSFHRHRDTPDEPARTLEGYATGTYAYFATAALEGDLAAAKQIASWTWNWHVRRTVRSLLVRPGALPRRLALAELKGAIASPARIVRSRRTTARARPPLPGRPPLRRPAHDDVPVARIDDRVLPVSVVVPSRSRRDLVVGLVESLDRQRPRCHEIVVVVDGDIDGTDSALRSLSIETPLVVVVHDENLGAAIARNRGAQEATSEIVLFVDDDAVAAGPDLVLEHWLAHQGSSGAIAAVGGFDPIVEDRHELTSGIRNWWSDHIMRIRTVAELSYTDVLTGNLSIDRNLFLRLGGFAALPRREDWEFGHRLERDGIPIRSVPTAVVALRVGVSVQRALHDRHLEAMGDVETARLHPSMAHLLPLGRWNDFGRRRRLLAAMAFANPSATQRLVMTFAPVLEAFSRHRLQRPFRRSYAPFVFLAYWSGVASATGSEQEFVDSHLARQRAGVRSGCDISEHALGTPSRQDPPWTAWMLDVTHRGHRVAQVPRHWGGFPWNEDEFHDQLRRRLRGPLSRTVAGSITSNIAPTIGTTS